MKHMQQFVVAIVAVGLFCVPNRAAIIGFNVDGTDPSLVSRVLQGSNTGTVTNTSGVVEAVAYKSLVPVPKVSSCSGAANVSIDTDLDIRGPKTITKSGEYCVLHDLICTDTFLIEVCASDVTIDLGGYMLTCTGAPGVTAISIAPGVSNVLISDGMIRGTDIGIKVIRPGMGEETSCIFLDNIDIKDCSSGIVVGSGNGIGTIRDSSIINCTVISCTTVGIDLHGCQDIEIESCTTNDNGVGVRMEDTLCIGLRGIIANGNDGAGFEFVNSCTATQVWECVANCNSGDKGGFFSDGGQANIFFECIAEYNVGSTNGVGFWLGDNEERSSIVSCNAQRNGNAQSLAGIGIVLDGCSRCTIKDNVLVDNQGASGGMENSLGVSDTVGVSMSKNAIFSNYAYGRGVLNGGGSMSNYVGSIPNVVTFAADVGSGSATVLDNIDVLEA